MRFVRAFIYSIRYVYYWYMRFYT